MLVTSTANEGVLAVNFKDPSVLHMAKTKLNTQRFRLVLRSLALGPQRQILCPLEPTYHMVGCVAIYRSVGGA